MGAALAIVAALLFVGYLRVSWTVAATSDGAAQALQARDMLAGNWRLHGWTLSDVSFYTTELPEYVLVELVRPLGTGVIHVAAAATYTLLVLAALLLARGRARGLEGLVRSMIAAGIMIAPQLGYGAFVLLLSPDHVGTQVPLLLGWLLLDRAPRRWRGPAIVCLLLAWVQFADRVALLTAVLPLVVVGTASAVRSVLANRSARPAATTGWRYELALAAAAIASVGLSWAAARLLTAAGGFAAHPFPLTLAPLRLLWTHTWLTGWGLLELYGANFLGVTGWAGRAFAVAHLIGLALAIVAFAITLARFLRPSRPSPSSRPPRPSPSSRPPRPSPSPCPPRPLRPASPASGSADRGPRATFHLFRAHKRDETGTKVVISDGKSRQTVISDGKCAEGSLTGSLIDSVLAVAIAANLLSYLLSAVPGTGVGTGYNAREIAAVLPYGAVLAARVFGPRISAIFLSVTTARPAATARPATTARPVTAARPVTTARPATTALTVTTAPNACRPTATRLEVMGAGGAPKRDRSGSAVFVLAGFCLVLAAYGAGFGYSAARPAVAGQRSVLARWLMAHGLRDGLGDAASANVVTVDSGGRVMLAATTVRAGRVRALLYQSAAQDYRPRLHDANFLVTGAPAAGAGTGAEVMPALAVRATFGRPARIYRFDGYTVMTWNVNLLTRLRV